jgi:hypothetical protein
MKDSLHEEQIVVNYGNFGNGHNGYGNGHPHHHYGN